MQTERINCSEIARRAGVSRAAASAWLLDLERRELLLPVEKNTKGKFYDAASPLIMRYIERTVAPAKQARKKTAAVAGEESAPAPRPDAPVDSTYSELELRKLKAQAEKLELETAIKRGEYLLCETVFQFFGQLTTVFSGITLPMGSKLSSELAAIFECTDPMKILKAQQKLDRENYTAVEELKKQIGGFRAAAGKG